MKCPHCNKPTSDIGKKCVHCGRDLHGANNRLDHVPLKCPLCTLNTDIIEIVGIELDYCYKCSGIWFDKGEIKAFRTAVSDEDSFHVISGTLEALAATNNTSGRTKYLPCPVCSQAMTQRKFLNVSPIILDRCPEHGTWTEKEDLEKILEIVRSGDIEELIAKSEKHRQRMIDQRLNRIETKQYIQQMELARLRNIQRTHLIFDLLGFL